MFEYLINILLVNPINVWPLMNMKFLRKKWICCFDLFSVHFISSHQNNNSLNSLCTVSNNNLYYKSILWCLYISLYSVCKLILHVLITLKSIYIGGCTLKINLVFTIFTPQKFYDMQTYVKQKVVFSFDNVLANPVENLLWCQHNKINDRVI